MSCLQAAGAESSSRVGLGNDDDGWKAHGHRYTVSPVGCNVNTFAVAADGGTGVLKVGAQFVKKLDLFLQDYAQECFANTFFPASFVVYPHFCRKSKGQFVWSCLGTCVVKAFQLWRSFWSAVEIF